MIPSAGFTFIAMKNEKKIGQSKPAPSVVLKVKQGQAQERVVRFTSTFLIGRHQDNDLQIKDACVSRSHVEIKFDGEQWWIRDLGSANGTYLDGLRIENVPLPEKAELELGKGGPVLSLEVERPLKIEELSISKKEFSSETQIIDHYFRRSDSSKAGEQTMMFRRAFERVHKKRSKKYLIMIGASLCLLLAAGSVILYQKNKLLKLRNTAIDIFYTMKSLDLQIAQLEELVLLKADKSHIKELLTKREKLISRSIIM